jgi:hypothetical protein
MHFYVLLVGYKAIFNNTGLLLQNVYLQSMQNDAKGSGEAITKS